MAEPLVQSDRSVIIHRVVAEIPRHPPDVGDPALFEAFVRTVLDRVRGPFLAQHGPTEILRYLQIAWRAVLRRSRGELLSDVRPAGTRGIHVLTVMDDQPFIIDTVRLQLRRGDATYWSGFHVIYEVERDESGGIVSVGQGGERESLVLLEADGGRLLGDLDDARARLRLALRMAELTVRDFGPMRRAVEHVVDRCEALAESQPDQAAMWGETAAFLRWLVRENFVFMGADVDGTALGIQVEEGKYHGTPEGSWSPPHPPGTVRVRKARQESPVHRAGRIDEVLVHVGEGTPYEAHLFLRGMFTYRGVTQPSRHVPILRGVLREELSSQEARPGTFRYKGIANVFDSLPTEFLFTTPRDAISRMVELVLDTETAQEVGATVLRGEDDSAFCLVSMPKGSYSEDLRRDVEQEIRTRLGCSYLDHGLFVGRFDTLLLHFYLTGLSRSSDTAIQGLVDVIRELATPWTARLWLALEAHVGEARADHLVDTYARAFPDSYVRNTPIERAVADLTCLEALSDEVPVNADLFEGDDGRLILRVFQAHDVLLTELLPVIGNFGLRVHSSSAVNVASRGARLTLDTFVLKLDEAGKAALMAHKDVFLEALAAVFAHRVDDDPLNELSATAGIGWRRVDVLRAYMRYMRQLGVHLSAPRVQSILLSRPELCGEVLEWFKRRFDPELDAPSRTETAKEAEDVVREALRRLPSHDEDVVFGGLVNLVDATVRTNVFRDDRPSWYISFKLDCTRIKALRDAPSVPMVEVYVHSREVEGVHLRFGRVARGGLRWSDRADFRTEVLGLVTTQQVKNVVIVPEGSKGGFYLRDPEPDPGARRAQADRLYETFIRGLLDVTDNVVDGAIVPPPQVVRQDVDDPYLVVAADKGTAHLSDTANRISVSYGFWLGDAFASGGSNGYDHKKVGITARGAWVLVRRHFAEMGVDPFTETFRCAGIGDMGGDVFGNGMLASRTTKLVAAFNHLHIFLDPDPDPEASWIERKRMFDAGGREGGWDRYNPSVLSEGGGVYDRSARAVPLSTQAREMLGLPDAEASPEDVIRAILRLDVDLMWSGGIGTYVKASHETHEHADDRTNDRFRVDAHELRCRIVGEGANLSLTLAARREAALQGVRLNTDFIDNSAGVDMSDHEVNLKILLNGVVRRGALDETARNELLEALTEEVAEAVLANNDTQGRQISRDALRSQVDIFPFARAIAFIEQHFGVSRMRLGLPDEAQLRARAARQEGLTRPELAMLSAWVKRWVYAELVRSGRARTLYDYPLYLRGYFPGTVQERYLDDIVQHQLADEIAMTVVTTRIVGDAGAAFLPMAVETTGRSVFSVCDGYLRAQDLARAYEVRATLEELRTSVTLSALYGAWNAVDAGCREAVRFWLSAGQRPPTDDEIGAMLPAVDEVYAVQTDEIARRDAALVQRMRHDEIPEHVAHAVLKASYLNVALMVWSRAKHGNVPLHDVAVMQIAVGRASRLQEVVERLRRQAASGDWEPIALSILLQRFVKRLRELVRSLDHADLSGSVDELEPRLAAGRLADVRAQVDAVVPPAAEGPLDLAALTVLEERVAGAIARLSE